MHSELGMREFIRLDAHFPNRDSTGSSGYSENILKQCGVHISDMSRPLLPHAYG